VYTAYRPEPSPDSLELKMVMTAFAVNSDNDLIKRFCRGDQQAFTELFSVNRNWVAAVARASARGCTKFRDPVSEAEDIASTSWFKVHQRVCDVYKDDNFKAWMRIVIRNTAIDACRKAKPGPENNNAPIPPVNFHPSSEFWKLSYRVIKVCLKELRQHDRTTYKVFFLRKIKSRSTAETAQELGIDKQEVSNRLNRAKQFLSKCLGAKMSS
jgi:RNA polymerase sigma factor (sigma-70 family)